MPTIESELDEDAIEKLINAAVATFDFTLSGQGGQTLGRDMVTRAAVGIAQRSADGLDPDGEEWAPNAEKYAEYKRDRYEVDRPGELGGQMLSLVSLTGKPEVDPDQIRMRYGTGERPQKTTARNSTPLKPHELEATDTEKAEWFTRGNEENNQPARPFYALDDEIADSLVELAADALGPHLAAAGY